MRPFGDAPRPALEQFTAAVPTSDHIAVGSLTFPGVLHQDRPTLYRRLAELPPRLHHSVEAHVPGARRLDGPTSHDAPHPSGFGAISAQ